VFAFAKSDSLTDPSVGISTWNWSLLTTVAFFGLTIQPDGSIAPDSGLSVWQSGAGTTLLNTAHANGVKVVVSLLAHNQADLCSALSASSIANTVTQVTQDLQGADGVNIDYEGSNTSLCLDSVARSKVVSLAQAFRAANLGNLSIDVYAGSAEDSGGFFDIPNLAATVNSMFVMDYGLEIPNGPCATCMGPTSPLGTDAQNDYQWNVTRSAVDYAPWAAQVILGFPYYGVLGCVNGPNPPANAPVLGNGAAQYGATPYATIAGFSGDPNITSWSGAHRDALDPSGQEAWATFHSGYANCWREEYWDDPVSLARKYDLVVQRNFRGAGIFTLDYGGGAPGLWNILSTHLVNPPAGGTYHPLVPARILDTRNGTGGVSTPLGTGQSINVQVAGQGGVPATGVSAVILNATVTNTTGSSFLTTWPAGQAMPAVSNLNWTPGVTVPNLVTVQLGAGGQLSVYNLSGNTDVIFDVAGWVGDATNSSGRDGLYNPLPPSRLLDTRNGQGPLRQGQTRNLQVTGVGGVPATGVSAVALNVTVTNPTAPSFLTVWPAGATQPTASNLNFVGGQTVPNRVIVKVGPDGTVQIFNFLGSVDVVVDVNGWFTDATNANGGSELFATPPLRIADTRDGTGGLLRAPLTTGGTLQLFAPVGSSATAVVLNVTAASPTAAGFLTLYPDDVSLPTASDLNFVRALTVPNLTLVKLGDADGGFAIHNFSGYVHVVVDLYAYFGPHVTH
jgi:hypothetical protein